jgi:hypothetical protein
MKGQVIWGTRPELTCLCSSHVLENSKEARDTMT